MQMRVETDALPRTPRSGPIRVLIAEDQPIVQLGLIKLIEGESARFELIGVASDYEELVTHRELNACDVILMDLHLVPLGEPDPVSRLVTERGINVVVLADPDNDRLIQMVMSGALGIVLKSRPPAELLRAIERVHAGEAWLERSLVATIIKQQSGSDGVAPRAADEHSRRIQLLTQKEREVIAALVEHRGAKSFIVAEALGISERTVRNRLTFIYDKLRLRGKLHLYVYALEHGLGPTTVPLDDAQRALARRQTYART